MEAAVRKQTIIFIATLVVCVFSVIGLVYFASVMKQKEASVITIKERIASYEENKRAFAVESAQLRTIGSRIADLEKHIVTLDTVPEFLSSIESLGKADDVEVTITTVTTPSAQSDTKDLNVTFSTKGTFANVTKFSADLLAQSQEIQYTSYSLFGDKISTATDQATGRAISTATPTTWNLLATITVLSF